MKRIVMLCCAMLMCVLLAGFAAAATDTVATTKDLSYKDVGLTLMPALYTAHQTKIGLTAQLYTAALATASNDALASLAPPKAPNYLDTKQLYGMVGKQPPNLTALGGEFTGAAPNTIYVLMNNPGKRLTNLLSAQPPDQLAFNTSLDQPFNLPVLGGHFTAAAPNSYNLLVAMSGGYQAIDDSETKTMEAPFRGSLAGFGLAG